MHIALMGLLVALQAPTQAQPKKLVIIPFESSHPIHADAARVAEGFFRSAAETIPDLRADTREKTIEALEVARDAGWRCESRPACFLHLALLDADVVVVAEVSGEATNPRITVRALDAIKKVELQAITDDLPAETTLRESLMRKAAFALLAPARLVGALELRCNVPTGTVWVGSQHVMDCPQTKTLAGIRVGSHKVTVMRDNVELDARPIDVLFDRTTVTYAEPVGKGARIRMDQGTKAVARQGTAVPATTTPPEDAAGGPSVLTYVGAPVAALGALAAVGGVVAAVTGLVVTALWPRTTPLTGQILRFQGESIPLANARVATVFSLIPVGLLVVVLGGVILVVGGGLAVADLLVKE